MSKFDDLITMANQYATARVEAGRGHILHDEAQEYSEEFRTAVRLLEAEHKALLNDQEELVRVKAELAAIRALEPVAWINQAEDYVELSSASTVYGSHTIPLVALPEQKK